MHRIIVLGRGMIGSATARHLAELCDGIVLLGPGEPANRAEHDGVFASHYDEGRMTRIVDPDPAWSITAKRSIQRYPDVEAQSGVRFFTPSGYLGIGGPEAEYLVRSEAAGRTHSAAITRLDAAGIRSRFSFLSVSDETRGLQEVGSAGHISPRAFVRAQTQAARRRGVSVIDDEATAIRATSMQLEVTTKGGHTLRAERVLVATGAFTDACGLLPTHLDLKVLGRTVALARIDAALMSEFQGMPTMGHAESGAYILPPIVYPDGNHYLKIGIGTPKDERLSTRQDLARWFKSAGSEDDFRDFRAFITALIPALEGCQNWHTDSCAVTQTPTGLPYIDYVVDNRIAVATGGNGKGAKSADDWGWLAARLMTDGDWDHPVERDQVRLPRSLTVGTKCG
jgi:sarcosine oxidase